MHASPHPDVLADADLESFDQRAATFTQQVTEIKVAPTNGYRLNTRSFDASNWKDPRSSSAGRAKRDVREIEDGSETALSEMKAFAARDPGRRRPRNLIVNSRRSHHRLVRLDFAALAAR